MEIGELRKEIDSIDRELVRLFRARMDISAQVADYKRERNLPIFVPAREREILQQVAEMAGPEMAGYTRILYSTIFELSRSYQAKRNGSQTPLFQEITRAIDHAMTAAMTDCNVCSLKKVCDEVEGIRQLHFGQEQH